jgi:5-methylcytosine-specific restriction enzyme subunit McrC
VYDKDAEKVVTVLDTKWKNVSGNKPSDNDLKQMFVYNLYYDCVNSALLYPSSNQTQVKGKYIVDDHGTSSLLFVELLKVDGSFKIDIEKVVAWCVDCNSRVETELSSLKKL